MTVYRLQNFEPPTQPQAQAPSAGFQLPDPIRQWIQAGLESEIPNPGDYLTMTVGASPIVILRNQDGGIAGFFNTCRHRGAQICAGQGHARRLVCPYHQWTYDLGGKLLKAGRMQDDFDVSAYQLRPVRIETVAGLTWRSRARSRTEGIGAAAGSAPLATR